MSGTVTPPVIPPVEAPWHQGHATPEMLGFWQNKGFDLADPKSVAIKATQAAFEAQKFVGVPPEQLLRIPKDPNDATAWKSIWERLGAPADATGYDFASVKKADGTDLDAAFTDALRSTAARLNMPKDAATQFAADLAKHFEGQSSAAAAERAAAVANEKDALTKSWGANHDANMIVARNAAAKLGLDGQTIAALEGQIGYAKVMEMMRNIGTKIGEDKFVSSGAPGQSGMMSVEQAHDTKRGLMADKAWVSRYMSGDQAAMRQMTEINTLIASRM